MYYGWTNLIEISDWVKEVQLNYSLGVSSLLSSWSCHDKWFYRIWWLDLFWTSDWHILWNGKIIRHVRSTFRYLWIHCSELRQSIEIYLYGCFGNTLFVSTHRKTFPFYHPFWRWTFVSQSKLRHSKQKKKGIYFLLSLWYLILICLSSVEKGHQKYEDDSLQMWVNSHLAVIKET